MDDSVKIELTPALPPADSLWSETLSDTAQITKFSIKDFFSKCEQIPRKLRIRPHLLKRSLVGNLKQFLCSARNIYDDL